MFEKTLILHKEGLLRDEKNLLEKIKLILKDKNLEVINYRGLDKNHLNDKNLVITVGGDGTFVRAANLIENSFILGININPKTSEGFLTSLQNSEIKKLDEIIKGKFKIERWQKAKTILNGKQLKENAINEVFVGVSSPYETVRYILNYKGKKEEQRSSGIIVATGTGSRAWFKSAGGKEFSKEEEKLMFLVREPYFGKRLFKPTILSGEILPGEKLVVESKRNLGGIVAINEAVYDFNKGDVVEISLSDKPLKVVVPL